MQCGGNWVSDQIKAQIAGNAQINPFHEHRLKQYDIPRHSSTLFGRDLGNNGLRVDKA
jgi:hypothetical protein